MFTIAATLTLAIAIGATASVFGVVDGVLLKAFPYRDPAHVLTVWESNPSMQMLQAGVAAADYQDFRAQTRAFRTLAAASYQQFTVTGRQDPERVVGAAVTGSYFQALGLTPVLGRPLAPDSGGSSEVVPSATASGSDGSAVRRPSSARLSRSTIGPIRSWASRRADCQVRKNC